MGLKDVMQACEAFKRAVKKKDTATALEKMEEMKEGVLTFESLKPLGSNSSETIERQLTRDFYEHAVLFAIDCEDGNMFTRFVASLQPFYRVNSRHLIETDLMCSILGMSLLSHLVEDRLPLFHCELEFLTSTQRQHKNIQYCISLEQYLMMGSYDQAISSAINPPVKEYNFFLRSLVSTIRSNIADCARSAYTTVNLADATRMLMFNHDRETLAFVAEMYPDWVILDAIIDLRGSQGGSVDWNITSAKINVKGNGEVPRPQIPSMKLIHQQLTFVSELERIV